MKRILLIVGLQLIAFWEVWRWYISRAVYSWDQPWGLLAFIAALVFLFTSKKPLPKTRPSLLLPALLIALYAATYYVFPPLARAVIAFTAFAVTLTSLRFGRSFHPGLLGLFYLSLPAIPSLQFFGGYPLRVVVAELTAPILRLGGFAVSPEGTCLNWSGQLIWIDGPCSGIKMLWVGMFLTFVLTCLYELPVMKSLLLVPLAFIVIIGGNVFRAVALFYLEAGVLNMPSWGHDYAGVIAFVLQAVVIVSIVYMLSRRSVCARVVSVYVVACAIAALMPFLSAQTKHESPASGAFPGWPAQFEGRPLTALPLTELEKRFATDFPGKIGRFTDGKREIVIRWVTEATRKLHPASDCFQGLGYTVKPLALRRDDQGSLWSSFAATKGNEQLHVYERIHSESGESWTDVSAWYWAAFRDGNGSWWTITVAEKEK